MTDKVTLAPLTSFTNDSTAVTQTNANNALLTTALDNTLSRDGTAPNQMGASIDMNSNRILNLPSPTSPQEPVRLQDVNGIIGGGPITFQGVPVGGTKGQVLEKNSSTNYDTSWQSLPLTPTFFPQEFGAFADGNSHPISLTDITNNPQWIGKYQTGVEWDAVAIQEAIYKCFATTSTPGNIIWNTGGAAANSKFYCPGGNYQVNITIQMAAQGFEMEWAGRQSATWNWTGGHTLSANTHSSTTVDGISLSDLNLFNFTIGTGFRVFAQGSGILPGTYVTSFNFAGGALTLSQAATSSGSITLFLWGPMFFCDSASFGIFRSPAFNITNVLPRGNSNDNSSLGPTVEYNGSSQAIWVLDGTSSGHGLLTQQVSIYDPVIFGNNKADVGLTISPIGGGSAEGATIQIFNPSFNTCCVAAIQTCGSNSLGNTVFSGDFIGNTLYCIQTLSGSMSAFNCTMEGQQSGFNSFSPQINQQTNMTADFFTGSGGGLGNPSIYSAIRSECSSLVNGAQGANCNVLDCSSLGADNTDWFANFPFQLGTVIAPSVTNTKKRVFVCVDSGGNNVWHHMTPGSGLSTITDTDGASYTTNQWAGFSLHFRFGSNGFTEHFTSGITSNTSNTVTFSGSVNASANSLYSITGKTGGSEPNWDGIANSNSPVNTQATGVAGSTSLTSNVSLSVGQYVVIPCGDIVGDSPSKSGLGSIAPQVCPYIGKVVSGSGPYTMSKPFGRSFTNSAFYTGTGTVDGAQGVTWIQLPFNAINSATKIDTYQFSTGLISGTPHIQNINSGGNALIQWANNGTDVPPNYGSGNFIGTQTLETGSWFWSPVVLSNNTATQDLTQPMHDSNYAFIQPSTATITFNAPVPPGTGAMQTWTLLVQPNGNSTLTFGTNFITNGPMTVSNAIGFQSITFVSGGSSGPSWVEVARFPAWTTFSNLHLDTGTKTATAAAGAATLNKMSGVITSESLVTAAGADYTLTLTNSSIAATDQVFASTTLGTATTGEAAITQVAPAAGSVVIKVRNIHASAAFNGTITIAFMVLKN